MLLVVLQAVKIKIHFGVLLLNVLLHCLRINHDMLWYATPQIISPRTFNHLDFSMKNILVLLLFKLKYLIWYSAAFCPGCRLPVGYCGLQCFRCWHVWLCLSNPHCSLWHSSCTWGQHYHLIRSCNSIGNLIFQLKQNLI